MTFSFIYSEKWGDFIVVPTVRKKLRYISWQVLINRFVKLHCPTFVLYIYWECEMMPTKCECFKICGWWLGLFVVAAESSKWWNIIDITRIMSYFIAPLLFCSLWFLSAIFVEYNVAVSNPFILTKANSASNLLCDEKRKDQNFDHLSNLKICLAWWKKAPCNSLVLK